MYSYKENTQAILDWSIGHGDVNEVYFGDPNNIDVSTTTNFPIVALAPPSGSYPTNVVNFSYVIYILDTFEESKQEDLEVLSKMEGIARDLVNSINKGSLFKRGVRMEGTISWDSAYNVRMNTLYGVQLTFSIQTPNDIDICV